MKEVSLKPCPFCGGEATLRKSEETKLYHIACFECGCRQDSSYKAESVINNWNTRKSMANIVEKLEEEYNNIPFQYETNYEDGFSDGLLSAINIVKQEINNGN